MFDYESPIKQIVSEMQTTYEDNAIKVVQNYGFDVDKYELSKALSYDRKQYEVGYQQGKEDGVKELAEKIMSFINTDNRGNCDYFIVDQIENYIAEQMKGAGK